MISNEKSVFLVGVASELVYEAYYLNDNRTEKITDVSLILSTLPAIDQDAAILNVSQDFKIPRDCLIAYELKI